MPEIESSRWLARIGGPIENATQAEKHPSPPSPQDCTVARTGYPARPSRNHYEFCLGYPPISVVEPN